MIIKAFAILSFVLVNIVAVEAAWPPKNTLCEKARVLSLTISKVDVCSEKKIQNTAFLEAVKDISEINHNAAKLFNVTLDHLFPDGLDISITSGYSGLNGSAKSGKNQITLNNYANPYRMVNKGIYAHELGHALSFSKSFLIPPAFKASYRSALLGETFADTIAFALVGEETSHEMNLPLCFSAKRVTFNQSYNNYAGFFDHYYNLHKLSSCCKEYADLNAETKKICETYLLNEDGETISLPPYNLQRFNFLDKVSFEEHRIGIPINSFILTLGQHTGKDLFKEFIQAFSGLKSVGFECSFDSSTDERQKVFVESWSLKTHLQGLRTSLNLEQRISYDVLWSELGIQAAVVIDDAEMSYRAEASAQKHLIKTINTNPILFKDFRSCADDFEHIELYGSPDEKCNISCQKVNPFRI